MKKTENGATTYYLRSSVLGGQVVAEMNGSAGWQRGFVYAGSSLLAVQQGGVFWMHEDPVTKSKRVTDSAGTVVSTIETDPWGADTNRSSNAAFQPKKFTSYDRDSNGSDEAMFRRFNRKHSRFDQPDPYDGSYNLGDPQSFNRYAYVQNDPVNFVDPSGLNASCSAEFSYADCGGDEGFWGGRGSGAGGGGFGDGVAEYNRQYGGMPQGVANALHLHNQRVNNDRGGYGFITNEEVRRIVANAFIRDLETGQLVHAGGAVWIEDTSNPFNFLGSGTLDQWPPQWPRGGDGFSEKFGWRTQPAPPMDQFPEKIRLGPKGVESRPEFDPTKVPSNASRSSRFARAGVGVIKALADVLGIGGRIFIRMGPAVTPALRNAQCNMNPNNCSGRPPT